VGPTFADKRYTDRSLISSDSHSASVNDSFLFLSKPRPPSLARPHKEDAKVGPAANSSASDWLTDRLTD